MLATKIKHFHALLYATKMLGAKEDLLSSYGAVSTKELSVSELEELICYLQTLQQDKDIIRNKEIRNWRHKVLRQVAACGIDTQNWNEVNRFLIQPRIAGKHLYECSLVELKSLHRKLQNVAINIAKKKEKIRDLTMLN